jgi:transcriptional regulator GlxA family with amidase domain
MITNPWSSAPAWGRWLAASEEGCSFRELPEEVRLQMAKEYLAETTLVMSEVSCLPLRSEPGSFRHAFERRWGMSPRSHRKRQTG